MSVPDVTLILGTPEADLCVQVMDHEPENEITITVFRLLVLDLLQLFQVLNQAMINILGMWPKHNEVGLD
jgi:hypothetical protein